MSQYFPVTIKIIGTTIYFFLFLVTRITTNKMPLCTTIILAICTEFDSKNIHMCVCHKMYMYINYSESLLF